jgi:hypothetical protein
MKRVHTLILLTDPHELPDFAGSIPWFWKRIVGVADIAAKLPLLPYFAYFSHIVISFP